MSGWQGYYHRVGEKPNAAVAEVLKYYEGPRREAFDLGAGNLRDCKFLLEQGFRTVLAVDQNPETRNYAVPGIEVAIAPIQDYQLGYEHFDFGVCHNTFFFFTTYGIELMLQKALNALRVGGVFGCNMLGERDEWALTRDSEVDFLRPRHVQKLQDDFRPLYFEEAEWDAPTTSGIPKHWHCWNLVIQRR